MSEKRASGPAGGGQIASVQLLRAIAAMTVVFGHAQNDTLVAAGKAGLPFARTFLLPWGAGVDLFFVISGFIMVYASERLFAKPGAPAEFFARRLIRIVPLYWLIFSSYLVVHAFVGSSDHVSVTNAASLLASYLFLPFDTFSDGYARPIYTLGWTLNYEMFFYAVFSCFLFLPRERTVAAVVAVLFGGVVLGLAIPDAPTALHYWTQPIVLEFALGMGIAVLARRNVILPGWARLVFVAAGVAFLIFDPLQSGTKELEWITPNDAMRVLGWGVPAALIMAAATLAPRSNAAHGALLRSGVLLGDASYALYLFHPLVVIGIRRAWVSGGLQTHFGFWTLVSLELAASAGACIIVHRHIERPATRWLSDLRKRRLPASAGSPA